MGQVHAISFDVATFDKAPIPAQHLLRFGLGDETLELVAHSNLSVQTW
jgi:hypothetical protein